MTLLSESMDNAISLGRLIWTMDDEFANALLDISKRHIDLVKEHLEYSTTPERRKAIMLEIESLRESRQKIIVKD